MHKELLSAVTARQESSASSAISGNPIPIEFGNCIQETSVGKAGNFARELLAPFKETVRRSANG
ncbi:hypothetical protein MPC1_7610003 [Methylocella tundrae]|nr:hypothetical protein MPC1_7610003 [Methylocella tundrae]